MLQPQLYSLRQVYRQFLLNAVIFPVFNFYFMVLHLEFRHRSLLVYFLLITFFYYYANIIINIINRK